MPDDRAVNAPDDEQIQIGYINGVHGVKGWVKVFSYTDPKENILTYPVWQIVKQQKKQLFEIEHGAQQGKRIVAKLVGIDDRNTAELWLNAELYISRASLPATEEDEYYWADLYGLRVITQDDVLLGHVKEMLETGAHDVLVVSGERERLIPFVIGHVVQHVDLEAGYIQVDWSPEFE